VVLCQQTAGRLDGPRLPEGKEFYELWLNDIIIACLCNILTSNDTQFRQVGSDKKPVYFADSFLYTQMMQDRRTDRLKGVYNYKDVTGRCAKVPGGSLLDVGASYLPILLDENHWVGGAILAERKEILLYNPSGREKRNAQILRNLLRLVEDEFKRTGDQNKDAVKVYLGEWTLIDVSMVGNAAFPLQENGKRHGNQNCFLWSCCTPHSLIVYCVISI